jgi:hypothetical protein
VIGLGELASLEPEDTSSARVDEASVATLATSTLAAARRSSLVKDLVFSIRPLRIVTRYS